MEEDYLFRIGRLSPMNEEKKLNPEKFITVFISAAAAKLLQSCLTLCDPIDSSPPGSPVPGILQARTLEWVAIPFSNAWKWKVKVKLLSRVRLFATPWTAAYQAPPSMGFSRQQYWSGVPSPSPVFISKRILYRQRSQQLNVQTTGKRKTQVLEVLLLPVIFCCILQKEEDLGKR